MEIRIYFYYFSGKLLGVSIYVLYSDFEGV